jgi:hypothetical protein
MRISICIFLSLLGLISCHEDPHQELEQPDSEIIEPVIPRSVYFSRLHTLVNHYPYDGEKITPRQDVVDRAKRDIVIHMNKQLADSNGRPIDVSHIDLHAVWDGPDGFHYYVFEYGVDSGIIGEPLTYIWDSVNEEFFCIVR